MAKRRMLSQTVVDTMMSKHIPLSAQALYLHLVLRADDEGMIDCYEADRRYCDASKQDIQALINAGYVIPFESGVAAISHWHAMNNVRRDRYSPTLHATERATLSLSNDGMYSLVTCDDIPNDIPNDIPSDRVDKNSIDKTSKDKVSKESPHRFTPPTLDEVYAYITENGYHVDAKRFIEFYEAGDWKDSNGKPVKNWKQKLITWERQDKEKPQKNNSFNQYKHTEYDYAELERKLIKN